MSEPRGATKEEAGVYEFVKPGDWGNPRPQPGDWFEVKEGQTRVCCHGHSSPQGLFDFGPGLVEKGIVRRGRKKHGEILGGFTLAAAEARRESIRQYIVMRKDLGMRKGKMIAQGAHASMKVLLDRSQLSNLHEEPILGPSGEDDYDRVFREVRNADPPLLTVTLTPAMQDWILGLFTKVCVYVKSEAELLEVYEKAKEAGLPCALIQDAGLTEFKEPTYTCCAIGPEVHDKTFPITGHLKLL